MKAEPTFTEALDACLTALARGASPAETPTSEDAASAGAACAGATTRVYGAERVIAVRHAGTAATPDVEDAAAHAMAARLAARFPQYRDDLLPLLETAVRLQRIPPPAASRQAVEQGHRRMLAALAEREQHRATGVIACGAAGWRRFSAAIAPLRKRWRPPMLATGLRVAATALVMLAVGAMAFAVLDNWGPLPLNVPPSEVAAGQASLVHAKGKVLCRPAGSTVWTPVSDAHPLSPGDTVHTFTDGTVQLVFAEGSSMVLQPDTEVTLIRAAGEDGSGPLLYLARGATEHTVSEGAGLPGTEAGTSGTNAGTSGTDAATPTPGTSSLALAGLQIRTPACTLAAEEGSFTLRVAEDGTTGVSVTAGQGRVQTGVVVRTLSAGEALELTAEPTPSSGAPWEYVPGRTHNGRMLGVFGKDDKEQRRAATQIGEAGGPRTEPDTGPPTAHAPGTGNGPQTGNAPPVPTTGVPDAGEPEGGNPAQPDPTPEAPPDGTPLPPGLEKPDGSPADPWLDPDHPEHPTVPTPNAVKPEDGGQPVVPTPNAVKPEDGGHPIVPTPRAVKLEDGEQPLVPTPPVKTPEDPEP